MSGGTLTPAPCRPWPALLLLLGEAVPVTRAVREYAIDWWGADAAAATIWLWDAMLIEGSPDCTTVTKARDAVRHNSAWGSTWRIAMHSDSAATTAGNVATRTWGQGSCKDVKSIL